MKTTSLLSAAALVLCTMFSVVPAAAASEARPAPSVAARLTALRDAGLFRQYNATHAQKVQQVLAVVYRDDPAFMAESKGSVRLSDGIVGPVTLKWLERFCKDRGLSAAMPDFEQRLVRELEGALSPPPQGQTQTQALAAPLAREKFHGPEVTYRYDPADPSIKQYPADLADRLKMMGQMPRKERAAFREEVMAKLDGLTYTPDLVDLIEQFSEVDSFTLTDETLARLGTRGLSFDAMDDLRVLVGRKHDSEQSFRDSIETVVLAATDRNGVTTNLPEIVAASRQQLYQVPPTLGETLASQAKIPEPVLALFAGMSNIEYPYKPLFDSARMAHVKTALGMCRVQGRPERAIADDQFATLKSVLPEALFNDVARLRSFHHQRHCKPAELSEAERLGREAYRILVGHVDRVAVTRVTNRIPPPVARKISWEVPGCDCGRSDRSGVVYGFYPLWTRGEYQIDFSQWTRIGLYGTTFDDTGKLRYPAGMAEKGIPKELIDAAHRHTTEVDWVVSRRDWKLWSRSSDRAKREILARLEGDILALLRQPLNGWVGEANELASLFRDPAPTVGDGVTIDFKNFPTGDKLVFDEFIKSLAARMAQQSSSQRLNIMMQFDEIRAHQKSLDDQMARTDGKSVVAEGAYSFTNIVALVADINKVGHDMSLAERRRRFVDDINVLVMISEPTTDSKKQLRAEVQLALHGELSQRLLRNIVPVIVYNGDIEQLRDDLIYISDNYGGVGFWPLGPAAGEASAAGAMARGAAIHEALRDSWQMVDPPSATEQFLASMVCPHRTGLRWAAWASLLLAVVSVIAFVRCTGCNERLDNSAVYLAITGAVVMAPFVLLFLLAVGDPLFDKVKLGLAVFCLVGLVVTGTLLVRQMLIRLRRQNP